MARIFIIEDDRGWEQFYRRLFRDFELSVFHDGVSAVAEMNDPLPDVVILDLLLNGPTGFEILNEMQSYPELSSVPVVIVSSVVMPAEDAEALECYGVCRSFDKATMDPRELLGCVASLVEAGNE